MMKNKNKLSLDKAEQRKRDLSFNILVNDCAKETVGLCRYLPTRYTL